MHSKSVRMTNFKRFLALMVLMSALVIEMPRLTRAACPTTGTKWPKVLQPIDQTGETEITAMD